MVAVVGKGGCKQDVEKRSPCLRYLSISEIIESESEDMKKKPVIKDRASTDRPAWAQDDLNAYKHKHMQSMKIGNDVRPSVLHNYYVKSEGRP